MKIKFYFRRSLFISVTVCIAILCILLQAKAQDSRTRISQSDSLQGIPGLKSASKRPIVVSLKQAVTPQTKISESTKQIIIQTGETIDGSEPIVSLGVGPSINNMGNIAFTALETSKSSRRVLLYDHGAYIRNYYQPAYLPGSLVQVNDFNHIAYWAEYRVDPKLNTFIFRLNNNNEAPLEVARGNPWVIPDPNQLFNNIIPYMSLANNDRIIFSGDLRTGGRVLASTSGSYNYQMSDRLSNSPTFFPMIADNNRAIVRGGASETANIKLFLDETLNSSNAFDLATYPEFLRMGNKPGISDDGRISVFMAEHNVDGAGIYVTTVDQNNAIQFKLAQLPGTQVNLDRRVAVNHANPTSKDEYLVVYLAVDNTGALTLYSIKINVSDPMAPTNEEPIVITRTGENITGLNGKIADLVIYDPVNDLGEIVFWSETETNNQAIIKAGVSLIADFTYEDVGKYVNNKWEIIYSFKDNSSPGVGQTIKEYLWEFGDGKTSNEKDPIHAYEKAGNFTVSITVTNSTGETNIKTIENCISDLGFRWLNAWSIPNSRKYIWPEDHWKQFNYNLDYGLNKTWERTFSNNFPLNSSFPDWLLFSETYEFNFMYIDLASSRKALEQWNSIKSDDWGGSCYGFATSALLFYCNYLQLNTEFSGYSTLWAINPTNRWSILDSVNVRRIINKYQIYQDDIFIDDFRTRSLNSSVAASVQSIQNSFINYTEHKTLSFNIPKDDGTGRISHTITPYKILKDVTNDKLLKLYVYDSSINGFSGIIEIDLNDNSFYYENWSKHKHKKYFYFDASIIYSDRKPMKSAQIVNNFNIYNTVKNDLQIIKSNEILGFKNDKLLDSVSFGNPKIFIETYVSNPRPKGYNIEYGEYKAILDKFESETTSFSVFTDTLSFFYKRVNTSINQNDILLFGSDYFKVVNTDETKKLFNFMCIFNQQEYEKVFEFNDVKINPGDTISYYFSNSSEVKMKTLDSASTYVFRANILTQTNADFYPEKNVSVNANTTQTVIPNWEDIINEGVVLKTDIGSDGAIDMTSNLNTFTGTSIFKNLLLVSVYPNPSQGKITIECNENVSIAIISVFDMYGRQIINYQLDNQQSKWTSEFDLSQFSNGAYLLKIVTDKKVFEKILIKN